MMPKRLAWHSIALCSLGLWLPAVMASAPRPAQPWHQDRACVVKPQTMPAPTIQAGCALAWRIALEPGRQLDICQAADDLNRVKFSLSHADEDPGVWDVTVMGATLEPSSIRLEQIRQTEDGAWRTLLAVRLAQTQGMGVSRWSLRSLGEGSQVSEPIETDDWGVMSFATQLPATKGCHVLISRWLSGHEPGRGAGLYAVGRWYQWGLDGFLPQPTRPVVYRRYLQRLEQQRDDALDAHRPLRWMDDPQTTTVTGPYPFE